MSRRVSSKQKIQALPEPVLAQDDAEISSSQQPEPLTTASPSVAKRIRKPKTLPRTEPPLSMNQSIEMTATGAPVISATQAYYKRPEWEEYSPGKLYFQRRFGKGRYVEFYIMNR
ncbi:hypothetical protein [Phormidesmis priestleyi]